jgi:hypothetical protein
MAGTCRWLAHAVNPVRRSPGLAADAHRQARVGSSLRVRETATPSLIETDGIAKEKTMPAKTEKQRKFMGAELERKREGKKTKTNMSEKELEKFASKTKES